MVYYNQLSYSQIHTALILSPLQSFHLGSYFISYVVPFPYGIPISSLFSSLFFQRIIMFKIMNALRVATKQTRKRRLCHLRICPRYSVAAVHSHHFHFSLHNEPETSKQRLKGRVRTTGGGSE